jgi:signal transduction histidine kinase
VVAGVLPYRRVMADRTPLLRARSFAECHPAAFDAALGLLIGALSIVVVLTGPGPERQPRTPTLADVGAAVLAFTLVALRRRWPVPVFAAATGAALWPTIRDGPPPVLLVAVFVCASTVAVETNRRTAWIAGGTASIVLYAASVLAGNGWSSPVSLGLFAWMGMAVAIGDALRTRRAYVAAIEERARRAEESRDEEARRRVVEERLRIARELHDVVAHHIAMINVQAGVAAHVLRDRPDKAEDALAHVRRAARTVLDEISTLLGVLRRPGDPEESEPTRGLARLGGLLDSLGGAGLRVEHHQEGDARELPSAVDLAAYRIVQESLTNAQKHGGDGAARLRLAYTPAGLEIEVANVAGPDTGEGGGHGLVGMRERASAVGGTLRAGRVDGRFVVTAFLPAPAWQQSEPALSDGLA